MLPHSILHVILKIELHFEVGTTSLLSSMKKKCNQGNETTEERKMS